jgi:Cft2 family RNA processing exonuclease
MKIELIPLGGALDPNKEKPAMGGTATLLKFAEYGILVDFGVYPQSARIRKAESEKVLRVEPSAPPITLCGNGLPDLSKISLDDLLIPQETEIHPGNQSKLPDAQALEEVEKLYVIATHGHADHIGGLPWLKRQFPKANVVMTSETRRICEWSWHDHLKITARENLRREKRGQRHRRIEPLYSLPDVENILDAMKTVKVGDSLTVGPAEVQFFFNPHILGAISVLVKVWTGSVATSNFFFTGDIRFKQQDLIHGMPIPTLETLGVNHIDGLVIESTYGKKSLPHLDDEADRFAYDVEECLRNGGKYLAASLAVDRGQKLFAALKKRGVVERWGSNIYIDGAVRELSRIYAESLHDPLLSEVSNHFVQDRSDRSHVLFGKEPACVITSSGMYVGGPSVAYAVAWAEDPRTILARTSFQDPCSPGDKLDKIAHGQPVNFLGQRFRFNAQVKTYAFSAHCDGEEITETIGNLAPATTLLHHGEESGMDVIREKMGSSVQKATINLPCTFSSI